MKQTNIQSYFTPTKPQNLNSSLITESSSTTFSTLNQIGQEQNSKTKDLQQDFNSNTIQSQTTHRIFSQSQNSDFVNFESSCSKVLFMDQEDCNQSEQQNIQIPKISSTFQQNIKQNTEEEQSKNYQNSQKMKISKGISKVQYSKIDKNEYQNKINKFDKLRLIENYKPIFSENANKIISQIQHKLRSTNRTQSPTRNNKLNSILNRKSLKDRYRNLLGSKVFDINNNENKDLLNLMSRIDEIMMRRARSFLSELINAINGLTIQKMNTIMNICPPLFNLSLKMNKFQQQDMLIELPNQENMIQIQEWKEQRYTDFKQRLYYQEQQQKYSNEQPSYISDKLTQTIIESMKEKNTKLNNEFAELLQKQQRQEVISNNLPTQSIFQIVKNYFEVRNVSNIFKINIVEHISKNSNITLIEAESKLNELLHLYPNWLTNVKSSVLGHIIRINLAFNVENVLN